MNTSMAVFFLFKNNMKSPDRTKFFTCHAHLRKPNYLITEKKKENLCYWSLVYKTTNRYAPYKYIADGIMESDSESLPNFIIMNITDSLLTKAISN